MQDDPEVGASRSIGMCWLPPGSSQVVDADEEVFLLYTSLQNVQDAEHVFRGLGYLDSHQNVLKLEITVQLASNAREDEGRIFHKKRHTQRRKNKPPEEKTIEVQLAQDTTALRSRKGDTGSVLWRVCMEFGQLLLSQWYSDAQDSLLDKQRLAEAHVLELGAGTGLLSILLSSLVQRYTVTDIEDLVPLLLKNLTLNNIAHNASSTSTTISPGRSSVTVDSLDWLAVEKATPSARRSLLQYPTIDLLLVVDCIYHPSLLPALVKTIDFLASPGRTTVVVVAELRAEDVVREFLEHWLSVADGKWEIWRTHEAMVGPYAVWVGWKKPPEGIP